MPEREPEEQLEEMEEREKELDRDIDETEQDWEKKQSGPSLRRRGLEPLRHPERVLDREALPVVVEVEEDLAVTAPGRHSLPPRFELRL